MAVQSIADRLLVLCMNIVRITGVNGDREAGIWNRCGRDRLRLPCFGPLVAFDGNGAAMLKSRQADDVKGEITLTEERTLVRNHSGQNPAVLVAMWEFCSPWYQIAPVMERGATGASMPS